MIISAIGFLLIGGGCKGIVDKLFEPKHIPQRQIEHTPVRSS